MKNFVAIYLGSPAAKKRWEAIDEKTRNERTKTGMGQWMEWGTENSKSIVDEGAPLGKTKRIDPKGISDTRNQITGYTIVQAESHEAAARLFLEHPHFTTFPGDSVEIMECLPIPSPPP
jgi:hypothetical protein